MRTTTLGILGLILLIMTVLFLVLFIASIASAGPLQTFEQVLAYVSHPGALFYLSYANVTLLTIVAMMFFAALYVYCRTGAPLWSAIAVVFIPVYGLFNLVAYFSQLTVVPRLVELSQNPQFRSLAEFLLRQTIQQWPGSTVSIFNNLAYAILGIPSIIFGVILYRMPWSYRLGAVLLALNGIACILGAIGIALQNSLLSMGSIVGAVFFLLALIPLSWAFLKT